MCGCEALGYVLWLGACRRSRSSHNLFRACSAVAHTIEYKLSRRVGVAATGETNGLVGSGKYLDPPMYFY